MRLYGTTWTVLVSTLAGCSLLYSPNNLPDPRIDAATPVDAAPPPDMPTDVNLDNLVLESVSPTTLLEGQGTGGSRPAVLVITGGNIGPDATIELVPVDSPAPTIVIDNDSTVRSPSGSAVAVSLTVPIDPTRGSDGASDAMFTVQVTQTGGMGVVTKPVPGAMIKLTNLPELTAPITNSAQLAPLYSTIAVPGGLTFAAGGPRALIRAVGSIELGDVHADAAGPIAGPGGSAGGATGAVGGGPSGGKPGAVLARSSPASAGFAASALLVAGAGGGYGEAGKNGTGIGASTDGGGPSGDAFIMAFASNVSSGGGGGTGNAGGGGGGTVEITAGGTLVVGQVTARGAAPSTGNGGGGSGGAIVVRAGGAATVGALSTAPGKPGGASGDGGRGRVRYDLPAQGAAPAADAGSATQGAMFSPSSATTNPVITTAARPSFQLISAAAGTTFTVFVVSAANVTTESKTVSFGSATAIVAPSMPLNTGYNQICVTVPGGNLTLVESSNCIAVAYVP